MAALQGPPCSIGCLANAEEPATEHALSKAAYENVQVWVSDPIIYLVCLLRYISNTGFSFMIVVFVQGHLKACIIVI